MERTNRPTQVGTRAPAGGQSSGVQQAGRGRQDGQWGDQLVQEYNNKISGQTGNGTGTGTGGNVNRGNSYNRTGRRGNLGRQNPYGENVTEPDGGQDGQTFRDFRRRQLYGENESFQYERRQPAPGGQLQGESVYRRGGLLSGNRANSQRGQDQPQGRTGLLPSRRENRGQAESAGTPERTGTWEAQTDLQARPGTGRQTARAAGDRNRTPAQSAESRNRTPAQSAESRNRTPVQSAGIRRQAQTGRTSAQTDRTFGNNQKSRTAPGKVQKSDRQNKNGAEASNGKRGGSGEKPPGSSAKKPGSGTNFLVQGSILAAAGIVVRLIGMVYRIPLARKIGDVGNGYYNAAYSIYSILLIMSSYSLPTAVSKMVSARLAKGQYRTSTKIFRAGMFYATMAGMAGFCALWFGADYFANEIIKMPYSSYALKSLAPTIWIMAYLGVLRGYFQGHSTMIPTAVSQVFEQIVNAIISIVAASILFDMGVKSNLVFHDTEYSYAFGAAGGAIGTGAGALTALVLFLFLTMGYVPTMRKQARRDRGGRVESYGAISRALFVTIVPIIISSAIYNVSNVVDNSIFGHVMEGLGESSETASQWGVYMGRYHMLFNIPVAIANSLSSSLIPSLSRAVAERNRRQIVSKIGSAIRFSMIIAIPSAVGLTVLAGPVSNLLFSGMDNEMLIQMMAVGSSAVVFFSLSTVSNAILQGINHMRVPIINSAISLAIHVAALYVMLSVFRMGIYSVVYANILFAVLVCILNAVSIARYTRYRQEIVKTFLIPCLASAAMGAVAWGVHNLCMKAVGNAVSTGAAIFAAMAVYFVLLILLKGVNEQELRSMPGGTRLSGVARKLHLM